MKKEKVDITPITLKQMAETLARLAASDRWRCMCGAIAKDQAEFVIHRQQCQLLRCAIIGDIVRVANMLGRSPTVYEYVQHHHSGLPSWGTLSSDIFDSWNDALAEARLSTRLHKKAVRVSFACVCGQEFTDSRRLSAHRRECPQLEQAIIDDVRSVAQGLGRTPSIGEYSDMKGKAIPGIVFIQKHFSSWNALLEKAALPQVRKCNPLGYDRRDKQPATTRQQYYWELEAE